MWVGDKAPLFHQPQLSIRNQCIIFTTWVSEWECYLCSERSNDPTDYSLHPFQERVARDSGRLILSDVVSLTRDAEVPVQSNRHRHYPSNPHVTQPLIYEWHLHARALSRLRPPFSNKVCTLWYTISSFFSITTLCPLECKKCGSGCWKKSRIAFFSAPTTTFLVSKLDEMRYKYYLLKKVSNKKIVALIISNHLIPLLINYHNYCVDIWS